MPKLPTISESELERELARLAANKRVTEWTARELDVLRKARAVGVTLEALAGNWQRLTGKKRGIGSIKYACRQLI